METRILPRKIKIHKKTNTTNNHLLERSFEFTEIRLNLKITDDKSMMCHHTMVWTIKNLNDSEPLTGLFYPIGGDTKRNFEDLRIKVTDNEHNELPITSIELNEDTVKQFKVGLRKPIKYKKSEKITLEYDWEEPKRMFFYDIASTCKKFIYEISAPSSIRLKHRILKIDKNSGEEN